MTSFARASALVLVLSFTLGACASPSTAPSAPPSTSPPSETPATETLDAGPVVTDELPPGSGDYLATLAIARRYQRKEIDFAALEQQIGARAFAPHPLGDGYLMIPVPQPPPGVEWNPRMMPKDWQGNWGEVAMAYWLGALTADDYNRLHTKLHPGCDERTRAPG